MIRNSLDTGRPEGLDAFASLVYPSTPEEFFADIWRQQIMAIKGRAEQMLPIITADQYLDVLYQAGVGSTFIRYTSPGETSPEKNRDAFFRLKAMWEKPPALDELAEQTAGNTLVFDWIAGRVPHAHACCRDVFKTTGYASQINAYFGSAEGASAFGAHFDTEDVFIIQVEGQKDWLLWETPEPSAGATWTDCERPQTPPDEIVRLSPGDILYVPRRHWHWPKTAGEGPSLHLTVQMMPIYSRDIARWIESLLQGEGAMDKGISYALSAPDQGSLGENLAKAVALLQEELADPEAAKRAEMFLTMRRMKQIFSDKQF